MIIIDKMQYSSKNLDVVNIGFSKLALNFKRFDGFKGWMSKKIRTVLPLVSIYLDLYLKGLISIFRLPSTSS